MDPLDDLYPVFCTKCRKQITRDESDRNKGPCDACAAATPPPLPPGVTVQDPPKPTPWWSPAIQAHRHPVTIVLACIGFWLVVWVAISTGDTPSDAGPNPEVGSRLRELDDQSRTAPLDRRSSSEWFPEYDPLVRGFRHMRFHDLKPGTDFYVQGAQGFDTDPPQYEGTIIEAHAYATILGERETVFWYRSASGEEHWDFQSKITEHVGYYWVRQ